MFVPYPRFGVMPGDRIASWDSYQTGRGPPMDGQIVLRNMDREEEERVVNDLTEIGYKREVIRVER